MKFAIGIILALAASSAAANPTKNKEDCVQNTGEFAFIEPMLENRVEGKIFGYLSLHFQHATDCK